MFDAEEYWENKEYKKYIVSLSTGDGKKRRSARYYIQARNKERAVAVAKLHCTVLSGRIYGLARLATPEDLGCR